MKVSDLTCSPVGNSVIPNIPPPSYSAVSQEGDGSDVIERRHSASMASSSNGINADNLQNSSAGGGSNSGSRRHSLPGLTPDGSNIGGPPSQNQTQTTDGDFKSLPTNTAARYINTLQSMNAIQETGKT